MKIYISRAPAWRWNSNEKKKCDELYKTTGIWENEKM